MTDDEDVPNWDECEDPILPVWEYVRPFDGTPDMGVGARLADLLEP